MSEAVNVQEEGILDNTPAAASDAGEIIQLADGRAAIRVRDTEADRLGAVATCGIWDVKAASGVTFAEGDPVYWDASADTAIGAGSVGAGDFLVGVAVRAKVSGQLVVRTDVNPVVRPRQQKTVAAAVTLGTSDLDSTIFGDTQAGAFSITLPPAASCRGRRLTFIRAGTGTNALTIDGNASETIDGSATHASMDAARDTITIESDGSNWFLVAARIA